jgi:hypothetical protein
MAKAAEPGKRKFTENLKQIGMVVKFASKGDKKFLPLAVTAVGVPLIVLVLILTLTHQSLIPMVIWILTLVVLAAFAFMLVLRNRSDALYMTQAEQTPGAAAQIIENIPRSDFRVTQALASTTDFDMVHLVLSTRGVIFVGEGNNPGRIRQLMGQEKRRMSKVIGSAPMSDMIIGNGEGEVPIRKLRMTLMKMPKTISPQDVNALDVRLKALTARPQMPKGTIPKNMRPQTGAFRAPRGR